MPRQPSRVKRRVTLSAMIRSRDTMVRSSIVTRSTPRVPAAGAMQTSSELLSSLCQQPSQGSQRLSNSAGGAARWARTEGAARIPAQKAITADGRTHDLLRIALSPTCDGETL